MGTVRAWYGRRARKRFLEKELSVAGVLEVLTTPGGLVALLQVTMIDLVLAGDNAIVIGLAAAGLAAEQRRRAILIGVLCATLLRIGFAVFTIELLEIVGLLLAGGLLLLWVCWKMWRELRRSRHAASADSAGAARAAPKTLTQATWQIVIADVSMSLDNVLAVAGAARLDRLSRPRSHPLRRGRYDLSRLSRSTSLLRCPVSVCTSLIINEPRNDGTVSLTQGLIARWPYSVGIDLGALGATLS